MGTEPERLAMMRAMLSILCCLRLLLTLLHEEWLNPMHSDLHAHQILAGRLLPLLPLCRPLSSLCVTLGTARKTDSLVRLLPNVLC